MFGVMASGWCTGIRRLKRGVAALPQGNQELTVVKDKVGRPQVRLEAACDLAILG